MNEREKENESGQHEGSEFQAHFPPRCPIVMRICYIARCSLFVGRAFLLVRSATGD